MGYNQAIAENSVYGADDYANYANTTDHKDFANWEYPTKLTWGAKWDKSVSENITVQALRPSDDTENRPVVTPQVVGGLIDADVLNELRIAANAIKSHFSNKTTDATMPAAVESSKILQDQVVVDDSGIASNSGNGILDALVDLGSTVTGPAKNSKITRTSINEAAKQLEVLAKYANYANYSRIGSNPVYANGYYANYSRYNQDYTTPAYNRTYSYTQVGYGQYRACCYCGGTSLFGGPYTRASYYRIGCTNRTGVYTAQYVAPADYTRAVYNQAYTVYSDTSGVYADVNPPAYTKAYANAAIAYVNAVYSDAPN